MADDLCGRSYRAGSGRYYDCERAAGHTGSHLPWPDSDQEPTVADDLRAEMVRTLRHELRLVAGPESRIPDALADAVLALPAVQEALAAADAVKRVRELSAEADHRSDRRAPGVPYEAPAVSVYDLRRALAGEDR